VKIKFLIPRLKPKYGFKEWCALFNFFDREKTIPSYESQFAGEFECAHATMFTHGRSGLYALFKVWGLNDDEVICPAYTCVVVPNAIVLSGNIPVFVDCQEGGFNMSLEGIEKAITPKTRAIVATHLFGYPMDVHAVDEIARRASEKYDHKIYVIQDCAHSYGARWNGELVTKYGDAAVFGCNISKLINSIFGGVVTTNNEQTDIALKQWRIDNLKQIGLRKTLTRIVYFIAVNVAFFPPVYSLVNWLERKGFLDRFVKYYEDGVIDFPRDWDQMPEPIEARVGKVQLSKYKQIVVKRIERATSIIDRYQGDDTLKFFENSEGATFSHLVAVVDDREAWVKKYRKENIQLGILIEYSVPEMIAFKKYRTVETPHSDFYAQHCINFPLTKGW
jgi:dTDP-4-amino-4,6-dideoxygalactose transaminase